MSRVLGVSRSGFYSSRQRGEEPTRRQQQRTVLDTLVADAFVAQKMGQARPGWFWICTTKVMRMIAKQWQPA